ncbi:MAG: outer membrane beta-barrel protein [Janthinobacterium lividum]
MKNVFSALFLAGTLAAAAPATAQTPAGAPATAGPGTLTGTATDSVSRQPLAFATAVLLPATGPQNPLSAVADERGAFRFAGVPAGQYALVLRYLGHRPGAPVAVRVGAGAPVAVAVALAPDRHALAEVRVTAAKPFIEQHADKLVLNVAASPIAAGGTAADVLARAPGVLEQGGGYTLRGKSVEVLLDGKYTNLSGEELKNMLASLPSNALDKVEIIANPSAKYDAKGGAVINLVTTKSLKLGTNGTATVGAGAGRYGRASAGLSLNHRTEKLNVYGSYDRLDNQVYTATRAVRAATPEVQIAEDDLELRRNRNNSAKLGLDYNLSKTAAVGVLVKGLFNERTRTADNCALLTGPAGAPLSSAAVATAGQAQFFSPAVSAYYKTTLGAPEKTLRVNADYFGYHKNWHNDYATTAFDAAGAPAGPANLLRDDSPARNAVKSMAADYAQPLAGGTFEAGLKTVATTTDNDIRWEQAPAADQPWAPDLGKTNHFVYRENINAAYATFGRSLKKVAAQVGLRAEQTNTTGTSLTLDQTTERSYLNFFSSASVQYTQSEKVQFGFAYRRQIDRFQFGVVNPFVTYLSPYRYAQGNPHIRPSFSHNFELTHTYGSLLATAVSYGYHTDVLIDTYTKDDATQIVVNSYQNFRSASELNATVTLMKPLLHDKWQTVTTLFVMYAKVNAGGGAPGLNAARPGAMLSTNHTLALPRGFKAEVSAQYMSPMTFGGLAMRANFGSSVGVAKTVLHGNGTLTLNVTDVFNTQQSRFDVLAGGVNSRNVTKAESRFVKLGFSYKFGNKNVKASQRRDTGTEAERARMDN